MTTSMWLPSAIVRQRDSLVAAVLEPRRVQVLNLAADCQADRRTLAEVGVCGHSISALLLDPIRDVVYTCGSDATLRAWNIKSKLQRWVWTDHSAGRTTLGQLRIRNARRDAVDQQWRHKRNYSRMSGEPRLFATKEILWVSGPSTLRAFDRRRGRELWTMHFEAVSADASLCVAHGDVLVSVQHGSRGCCQIVAYIGAGVELWRQQLKAGVWVHWLVGLSDQLCYVQHTGAAHGGKSHQELVSRNLATGEVRWSWPHDRENGGGPVVKLEACGGVLWCFCGAGRELQAIDPSNGSPRWSIELTTHVHTHGYFLTTTCVAVWGSRAFVSDGKAVHALHLHSGDPVEDWAQAGMLKVGTGFHDQPPPTLVTCESGLLMLQRTMGERTATECTLSCFDCESNGKMLWKAGAHRSSGTITLHRGMDSLIGSSRIPSAGNDTSAAGKSILHVFHADNGVLWAAHSVPTNERQWQFVPGGVVVHINRGKTFRRRSVSSTSDNNIDGCRSVDSLQCLDHSRQHDHARSHNVASVSSGHLDLASTAANAATLRWTWASPSGKNIDAWAVHPSGHHDIFVLTHDRVVHVLNVLTGISKRSFAPGSAVPATRSRHGRPEASVGMKDLLLFDDNLVIKGVSGFDGIVFSAINGNARWRPDAFGGAVMSDTTTVRPGTAGRPSTAGARAEVGAAAALLSASVVVTLSLAPIERGSNKATGTIFGRSVHTGTLLWSMSLSDELNGHLSSRSSRIEVWPLRRHPKETKLLSLESTPRADVEALHFRRIVSALALRESTRGSQLFIATKRSSHGGVAANESGRRSRPVPVRYHVRCFDASPEESKDAPGCLNYQLGPPYDGELWHYPPGHEENGWDSAITCMEITSSGIVAVGSASGKLYCLGVEKGNLIKTIDWLHVDEVSALASGNGMLWSASSQVSALRLKPLSRFGVVAAATQAQLASSRGRFQALWLVTVEFWLAALMAVVEAIQLLRFAAASEVCSESSISSSTCIHGYQMQAEKMECAPNSTRLIAVDASCCGCGGGETSDNMLNLPPSVSAVLREVSNFGLDRLNPVLAVWTGCSLILCYLTVILLAEPVKRKAFFSPDGWQVVLLSALSVFANLMCQPLLVPTLRLVSRGLDCSYYNGTGWLLDNSGSPMQRPIANADNSSTWQALPLEHDWQRCWEGDHIRLMALPALVCLFFYVPACVRLLRAGGSLMALSNDVSSVLKPWAWCSSKDDDIEPANRHPFSMRDGGHKLLVVGLKAVGVLAAVFLGTKHRLVVSGVLVVIATCMALLSCTLSPFHGEAANRLRAAIDFAVLTSYVAALALAILLQQAEPAQYHVSSTARTALYYPSERNQRIAGTIASLLPGLVGLSLICGWLTRSFVQQRKAQWTRRRVHAQLQPPPLNASLPRASEGVDAQLEQSAALIIQQRQRTRSSGRRLAAAMLKADTATNAATSTFGSDATIKSISAATDGERAASELERHRPPQLPPLVPVRSEAKRIQRQKP